MIKQLSVSILMLLFLSSVSAQEYFEKNFKVEFERANQSARYLTKYNGALYAGIGSKCDDNTLVQCSYICKLDTDGNILWYTKNDTFGFSHEHPIIIIDDTISAVMERYHSDTTDYIRFCQWDLNGDLLKRSSIALNDTFSAEIAVSIEKYKNHYYICGHGRYRHKDLIAGYVYELDQSGEVTKRMYMESPEPDLFVNWPYHFLIEPDTEEFFVVINTPNTVRGPSPNNDKKSIHKIDLVNSKLDSVFRTFNRTQAFPDKTTTRFVYLSNGNIAYFDNNRVNLYERLPQSSYYFAIMDADFHILYDFDFESEETSNEEYELLGMDRVITDMIRLENDDLFLSGYQSYYKDFESRTFYPQTAWFARVSSQAEILWEKNYTELLPDDETVSKRQYATTLVELDNGDLMGLGTTLVYEEGLPVQKPWLTRMNEHGCLNGLEDCNFRTVIQDTLVNLVENNTVFQSWEIYPNPVQRSVRLKLPDRRSGQLYVYNLYGNLIWSESIPNGVQEWNLNLENHTTGQYSIHFVTKDKEHYLIYQGNILLIN